MIRPMRWALALGALLLILVSPASGEVSPEAKPWVDKLMGLYSGGPFTNEYTAKLDVSQGGQSTQGDIAGKITWADREHMRVEMKIAMSGMVAGSDQPVEMSMLNVNDGKTSWTEIEMPALGGKQVMKVSLADMAKLAESGGAGMGGNPAGMDPVQQLESMAQALDFELVKVENGKVYLTAEVTPETRGELGQLGSMPGADKFDLVLDESTGHPVAITIGGDKPLISMDFGPFVWVERDSLSSETFSYTPPEGVPVMDLGAMLNPTQ